MAKQNFLWVLFLFFASNLYSQSNLEIDREAITKVLYQHANDDSPGLAVGMVKDGQIVFEHYMGYANLEHQIKVNQDTRFNIASNAKQFTALCILKLIDLGKVNLEDDIRKFLPELYPKVQEKITVSQLITHTSGVRDVHALWSLKGQTWWKLFLDNGDAMNLLRAQTDLNFKPGTQHLYSNSNYILLTEIVKIASGQDFDEFALSMFEELDMPNTGFLTNYMAVIPHKARPYGNWNGWREYPSITEIHGDGGLFTTLKDQLKWEQIIQLNDGKYLSQKLINQSQSPIADGHGFGLVFDNYKGLKYRYHNGSTGAYKACFLRFPDQNLSIVVQANNGSVPPNYLAKQVADIVLGLSEQVSYPADPDKVEKLKGLQAILGQYRNEAGTIIAITEKEGSIYREIYQRKPVKMIGEKGGLFHYSTDPELKMNFTNIGKEDQQFTIYRSTQEPTVYRKLPDSNLDQFDRSALNGSFFNGETDTKIQIQFIDNNTYSVLKNDRKWEAELILEDYLRMDGYEIRVVRDETGQVKGLSLDNDRLRNVRFERTDG